MSARRTVALAALWLGVVLVGSTLVWVVISRVGGEMSQQPVAAETVGPKPDQGGGSSSPDVPAPETTSDTWSGVPGTMRVTCRGTAVTDWSASPDVGWYLETEREDGGVRADFEQESEGREIRVQAVCTPDGPTFQTSNEDG
ncbi:MAG: hypothetical protein ACXWDM_07350 [Nocardioides sp.]